MIIKFKYTFEDGCYGYVDSKGEREIKERLSPDLQVCLPPCEKSVKIIMIGKDTATVCLGDGKTLTVTKEETELRYSESYESFGDVRDRKLAGTVRLIEE